MAIVRRSPLDPYPVTPGYLATRNSALHIPPMQFSNMKFKSDEVYGMVIDIPMGQTVMVTMVCFINGAANLYFNNGGEYTGASTKYKSVVQAARNLVVNANELKQTCREDFSVSAPRCRKAFCVYDDEARDIQGRNRPENHSDGFKRKTGSLLFISAGNGRTPHRTAPGCRTSAGRR